MDSGTTGLLVVPNVIAALRGNTLMPVAGGIALGDLGRRGCAARQAEQPEQVLTDSGSADDGELPRGSLAAVEQRPLVQRLAEFGIGLDEIDKPAGLGTGCAGETQVARLVPDRAARRRATPPAG
jgi:hypothetical protein